MLIDLVSEHAHKKAVFQIVVARIVKSWQGSMASDQLQGNNLSKRREGADRCLRIGLPASLDVR